MTSFTCASLATFIFILQTMIPTSKSSPTFLDYYCSNDTMYSNNSQYQTNLNTLFHYLSSNSTTSANGFYFTAAGNSTPDPVFGNFLCRGDQNITSCSNCVTTATTRDLPRKYCPNGKVAMIWYEQCMVRYSNESFLGVLDQDLWTFIPGSPTITTNKARFLDILGSSMNHIVDEAANEGNGKKYATRVVNLSASQRLYMLEQCTPDLSASDCAICLKQAIGLLPKYAQILMPNCIARYATFPFFDLSGDISAMTNSTSTSTNNGGGKKKASRKLVVAIVASISSIVVASIAILIYYANKRAKKHVQLSYQTGDDLLDVGALQYDLSTLEQATNHFSGENELGHGGFGVVYKGTLAIGQEIAVKKLSTGSSQGVHEFKNEVLLLAKLQHRNLVRLLGFCLAREEKLLVYEHVPNKSLDYFLFDPEKIGQLGWRARYKIIIGVARGILYLHQDAPVKIIHRDLKPSNILLDMDMNPKIADFGMARIFGTDQLQSTTNRVVGT